MSASRAMRDSTLGWLGLIPEAWELKPFFTVCSELNNKNKGMKESNLLSLSYGNIVLKDIDSNEGLLPESFEGYQIVEPDDLVFRFTDLQNDQRSLRSAISQHSGIITSAYLAVRPVDAIPKFLAYLMRAYDQLKVFYSMGGGLRQAMNFQDVKRLPLPIPPLDEQQVIVEFLDRETAQIDALIDKQQQLIETLEERRKAFITSVVTRGLDPTVPLTDSGVEWLGMINGEWKVSRLGHLVSRPLKYGANESAEFDDPTWPRYLRITDFDKAGRLREDTFRSLPPQIASDYLVEAGDILIARSGATSGKSFLVPEDGSGACFAGYLIQIRADQSKCTPSYISYFLNSSSFDVWRNIVVIQATIENIGAQKYSMLTLPLPPVEEQNRIVAYLNEAVGVLDQLNLRAASAIELLKERRQALINAAVTGKIDVRGK